MANSDLPISAREVPTLPAERALFLQEMLVTHATGGNADDDLYRELRRELIRRPDIKHLVPSFVNDCRTLSGFWSWIKAQAGQWEPRRALIREAFADLLDHLESDANEPADNEIMEALAGFDAEGVRQAWEKALQRRRDDPEGAVTAARTLIETVCKRILDDADKEYDEGLELPKLYGLVAAILNLAPDAHTEAAFKSILGSCQNVINNLGTLRNRLGDAHGKSRKRVRPAPRHAALAVNLAGSMALFLAETYTAQKERAARIAEILNNPEFVADVLSRTSTSEIVKRKVELKRAGREWRGLSPFIEQTIPSFYVNDVKGFYHCFSTSRHGSALDFLTEVEGLEKSAAVAVLAEEAGILPEDWSKEPSGTA